MLQEYEYLVNLTLGYLVDSYIFSQKIPCPRSQIVNYIKNNKSHIRFAAKELKKKIESKTTFLTDFNKIEFQQTCKLVFDKLNKEDEFPKLNIENATSTEIDTLYKICLLLVGP